MSGTTAVAETPPVRALASYTFRRSGRISAERIARATELGRRWGRYTQGTPWNQQGVVCREAIVAGFLSVESLAYFEAAGLEPREVLDVRTGRARHLKRRTSHGAGARCAL